MSGVADNELMRAATIPAQAKEGNFLFFFIPDTFFDWAKNSEGYTSPQSMSVLRTGFFVAMRMAAAAGE